MQPLVTNALMRESDAFTIANFADDVELMDRAGTAVYRIMEHKGLLQDKRIAVVCGSGNNAGDGFRLVNLLDRQDIASTCYFTKDPVSFSATHFFSAANSSSTGKVEVIKATEELDLTGFDVVVDCLLGTGFSGEPRGLVATCIEAVNKAKQAGAYVVSVDINSGMNGDTGEGTLVVDSDLTIAIGAVKVGMTLPAAGAHIGEIATADIGITFVGTPFQLIDQEEMEAVVASTTPYPVEAPLPYGFVSLIALANEARNNDMAFFFEKDGGRAVAMTGNLFVQEPAWVGDILIGMTAVEE